MKNAVKENLIKQYKDMRVYYFNILEEDNIKFEKKYGDHPLYERVVKHFDKSFTQVNKLARLEIDNYLNSDLSTNTNQIFTKGIK